MSGTTQLFDVTSGAVTADTTLTDLSLNNETLVASSQATPLTLAGVPLSVALVPQDGVYFIDVLTNANATAAIYEEHAGQAPSFASTAFTVTETNFVRTGALGIDTADSIIYYTNGTGLYAQRFGAGFTGSPATVNLGSLVQPGAVTPSGAFAYDNADHTAYYAGVSGSVSTSFSGTVSNITGNYIYKISGLSSSVTAAGVSISNALGGATQVPLQDGLVQSMVVDPANDTLYFTTEADSGLAGAEAGLYALALSGASAGHLSTIWAQTITGSSGFADMVSLSVDSATGEYYIVNDGTILAGNIASGALPTLLAGQSAVALADGIAVDSGPGVSALSLLDVDARAVSGSLAVGVGDSVTFALTLSEAVSVTGTPTLTLNDGATATYAAGSGGDVLLFDYAPASGQNVATLAVTGFGGTISDSFGTALGGALGGSFAGLRVDTTPPSLSLTGTSAEALQGGGSLTVLAGPPLITDADGTGTLTGARVNIANPQSGDVLGLGGASAGTLDGGAISFAVTGDTLVLSGSAGLAAYAAALAAVTYQDTGSDPSSGKPTRTLDWMVSEGTLTSTLAPTTLGIERALTITAGGTITLPPGTTRTLAGGLTLTDLEGDPVTAATIAITGDFAAGESLGFTAQNGISGSYNGATGVLTLSGTASAAQYQAALDSITFTEGSAAPAGTLVTVSYVATDAAGSSVAAESDVAICFLHGTRILTPGGERAVEDLAIGDPVVTRLGGVQRIKWLGRQSFAPRFLARNPALWPVRIGAGALAPELPRRDLFVSPGHSMLLGETLVLAQNLVNGLTITQSPPAQDVHYVQLEFAAHDCVLAEGSWSESFADGPGLRARFHNAAGFAALYPDYETPASVVTCRPRPLAGPDLAAALAPVLARAAAGTRPGRLFGFVEAVAPDGRIEGWAWDEANPRLPVWLAATLHGRRLATMLAADYRGDLQAAGYAAGHCMFSLQLPAPLSPAAQRAIRIVRLADAAPLPRLPTAKSQSA